MSLRFKLVWRLCDEKRGSVIKRGGSRYEGGGGVCKKGKGRGSPRLSGRREPAPQHPRHPRRQQTDNRKRVKDYVLVEAC